MKPKKSAKRTAPKKSRVKLPLYEELDSKTRELIEEIHFTEAEKSKLVAPAGRIFAVDRLYAARGVQLGLCRSDPDIDLTIKDVTTFFRKYSGSGDPWQHLRELKVLRPGPSPVLENKPLQVTEFPIAVVTLDSDKIESIEEMPQLPSTPSASFERPKRTRDDKVPMTLWIDPSVRKEFLTLARQVGMTKQDLHAAITENFVESAKKNPVIVEALKNDVAARQERKDAERSALKGTIASLFKLKHS